MTFKDLNLNTPLLNALEEQGFEIPTSIQSKAFSVIMSGRDVVGLAQTGTGKTLAYLLPLLRLWKFSKNKIPQILILVPTRELVVQVEDEVRKLATYMNVDVGGVYGGVNMNRHIDLVNGYLDVLVATPGRMLDLALSGNLKLKDVKRLVIDEVDEMLNLGFRPQLERVLDLLPPKRQNLMFSATITEEVENLIEDFFTSPEYVEAAQAGTPLEKIQQLAYKVPTFKTKVNLLKHLLEDKETYQKVLVFTSSKRIADLLFESIEADFPDQMGVLHSNKAQSTRFNTINAFEAGVYHILIATDVVARGLDIDKVTHVFNFDLPEREEPYIHRIGRTGRANKDGVAISFITEKDKEYQKKIEAYTNSKIKMIDFPDEIEIDYDLIPEERPKVKMKNLNRVKIEPEKGSAFHEKKAKNQKTNKKVRRVEELKLKYKKPKTRGDKTQNKKKR